MGTDLDPKMLDTLMVLMKDLKKKKLAKLPSMQKS